MAMLLMLNALQGAPRYRPTLVLPEELHVAISFPCSDKFTVPQHAHRHVNAHPEASLALAVKHVPIVHAHLQAARTTGVRAI